MRTMLVYSLVAIGLGAVTDALGASTWVALMVGLVGPPALHVGWLLLQRYR